MIRYSASNAATQRVQSAPEEEQRPAGALIAGIRLEPLTGEIFRNGKRSMLTRTEMVAFTFLLERYPGTASRSEIIDRVSPTAPPNEEAIDQMFFRMRPKLVPIRATIQGVYGKGHKITFL